MIGLDCNVLVQLAFAEHPANATTHAIVEAEIESGTDLVFPSLVITEFLHVATDGRRFSPPFTMSEAVALIQEFMPIRPSVCSSQPKQAWLKRWNG